MTRTLAAFALLLAIGCDRSAVVRVDLKNNTSSSEPSAQELDTLTPARFGVRLSNIYLAEDVDFTSQRSSGDATIVWRRRSCIEDCSYIDLARRSEQVNAELETQAVPAKPGTYRYVRLVICHEAPSGPTMEWRPSGMREIRELTHEWCALTSSPIDPPLVLDAGDAVEIALEYDLATAMRTGRVTPRAPAGTNDIEDADGTLRRFADCVVDASGTTKTCLTLPTITPKVSKLD
jgi:hypothetical protein